MADRAVVAVVPIGHEAYFDQFPGLRESLSRKAGEFQTYFHPEMTEVHVAEYVGSARAAMRCAKSLRALDPDAIFLLLTTYVPSAVAAQFAVHFSCPQILVGIQPLDRLDYGKCTTFMQLENDDICAMPEIAGVYARLGRAHPACIVAASGEKARIARAVEVWERALWARAAFRYAAFGYLGHTYEGMYDMHTDPTMFTGTFGAHVEMLEMCDLMDCYERVTGDALASKLDAIRAAFTVGSPTNDPLTAEVGEDDLALAARAACALDKLVAEHDLTALAYYYKGLNGNEYEKLAASLIVGNTLLTSRGVPLAGEADLKTAAAMLVMNRIAGGGTFAELHPFDISDDVILVGHDGPHHIGLCSGKPVLRKLTKYHGKRGAGLSVEFGLRKGPVTLLSLSSSSDGRFRMVAAAGTSVEGEIPHTGNTNTRVRFAVPVTEFVQKWSEAGPTHHLALACGSHIETLRRFASVMDVPLTVVAE